MKTNKSRLLFSAGALVLLGAVALEGCSSDDSSGGGAGAGGKGGTSAGGKGGTSAGGKGGTGGTAGTSAGGKGGTGAGGTGAAGKGGTGAGGTGAAGKGGTGTGPGGAGGDMGLGGMAGDMGAAGAPPIAVVDCVQFCADEQATCTFGTADMAPYADSTACMAACNGFTPGDVANSELSAPAAVATTSGDTYACRRWHLFKAGSTPGNPATAMTHCPHTGATSLAAFPTTAMPTPAAGPCH